MFETLIWLVPAAVLVGGIAGPRGGLLVLAACLPLFGSPPGGPYLAALDVAAIVAIATALRAPSVPASWTDRAVVTFVAVSGLSLAPLAYRPPSWQPRVLLELFSVFPGVESWSPLYTWRAFASLMLGCGLYFAVRRAFAGRSLRPLGTALAVGCGTLLVLGVFEQIDLITLGGYRAKGGPLYATRLHSLFFHSGWLAEFVVLAVPFATSALLMGRRLRRGVALLIAVLAVFVIVLTEQRGAWFAAAVQLSLLAALWLPAALSNRRQWLRAAATGATLTLLVAATVVVRPDAFDAAEQRGRSIVSDLSGRTPIWLASLELATERPALGWGIGSFAPTAHHLGKIGGDFDWLTSHNHLLMLAAERGFLGLAAFLLVGWAIAVALWRALRRGARDQRLPALGLVVGFTGIAVFAAVQYIFFIKMIEWLFWMLAGATATLSDTKTGPRTRFRTWWALPAACVLLLWRVFAVEPVRPAGDRSFGFHRIEPGETHDFEWTDRVAARRLRREGDVMILPLANGHPRVENHPLRVVVRVDGQTLVDSEIGAGWKEHRLDLPAAESGSVLLEIRARPVFRPYAERLEYPDLAPSTDIRRLGVAVGPVRWMASSSSAAEEAGGGGRDQRVESEVTDARDRSSEPPDRPSSAAAPGAN